MPVWLERDLFPGRGTARRGLADGFKPFELPAFAVNPAATCRPHFWEGEPAAEQAALTAEARVPPEVLARSEFLLPLQPDALNLLLRVLAAAAP